MQMNTDNFKDQLGKHSTAIAEEQAHLEAVRTFINRDDNAYSRSNLAGHITASAWILSPDKSAALLIHH